MTTADRPLVIHTIAELREFVRSRRERGASVALVPTMGALHNGHLSLVERAAGLADTVVVSIFVNPLQFGVGEDLERYPRALDADVEALGGHGAAVVFAPSVDEMYPNGPSLTRVTAGPVGSLFEGATRPGHFDGMLTVVAKLFNIVQPDVAVFGQKDAQQVRLVKQMVLDLNLPLRIEVAPTVREDDGLALSSRNRFLTSDESTVALVLSKALQAAADSAPKGAAAARDAAHAVFANEPGAVLDYFEIVGADTFQPVAEGVSGPAVAIVAASVGATRLIDNRPIDLG
ncbi:pantoate--beta-alanine ligase [Salinibacterium hongtaonis]|uniref:Pantothenate synthetase n=1 Tax=Homoserinimonas hongtaonis TaxID=2079791 RepID=A0A2U1T105_9MICO|nr:pantoate--beta-alanine ligase [Salinibacterium hongtaonis]PWB97532.1 pantoate--beta-alanine ligase [Salinibacterium hongtaonis]